MKNEQALSILKHRFFPSFYKHEAPRLVEFMHYYLQWLQDEKNAYWTVDNLDDFTSIDGTIDEYIEHLKNEIMIDFPEEYAGDLRYIMKHLVMLYRSKGTLASYKFFFRAMYDSYCDIYYPREQIIKASDGKWIQGYYCYCSQIPLTSLVSLNGRAVTEVETGLKALISDIRPYYFLGEEDVKYCLILTDMLKPFTIGSHFTIEDYEGTFTLENAEYSDGYWEGTDGFLDSDKVLQDSFYYQNFSYEITSLVPFNEYRDIVQRLIHPAGMKLFSRYQLVEDVEPIGCPDKGSLRTSFLRWWVLKMFMLVYANMKSMWRKWYIKWTPETYQFPFTVDCQYYWKDYGQIGSVRDETPNDLYRRTNDSNKMIFTFDGEFKQEKLDWVHSFFENETNEYSIASIFVEHPVIRTTFQGVQQNLLTISDKPVEGKPFVFVGTEKVQDRYISQTTSTNLIITDTKFSDTSNNTPVSIFSLKTDIIKRTIKIEAPFKNSIVSSSLKGYSKEQILVFIDGFLNTTFKYDIETGTLSGISGDYAEIYVLTNEQDLVYHNYEDYLLRGNGKRLSTVLPLRDVRYSFSMGSAFTYRYKKYSVFLTPYNADQQVYNKQYMDISHYETLTGTDMMTPTNESCKLCFHDGLQFVPDWINYKTTSETNVDNIIASLESVYPHIHTISKDGVIDLSDFWNAENENFQVLNKPYKLFVFIDGKKILDSDVILENTKVRIKTNSSGIADIYFIEPKCIEETVYYECNGLEELYRLDGDVKIRIYPYHDDWGFYETLQFKYGDRTLYLPFYEGKMVWTQIENGRLKFKYPKATTEYFEIYRIKKSDKYSVISYIQDEEFTYSNPTNIMLCYNPVTNIRV